MRSYGRAIANVTGFLIRRRDKDTDTQREGHEKTQLDCGCLHTRERP